MPHRESRYVRVARLAHELAQEVLPRYTHPKSPRRYTFPQLAACVLVMVYLDKSYRDMEEWLLATDAVCAVLALQRVPDHSTLNRTLKRLRLRDLDAMRRALLSRLPVTEEVIALDSTGFRRTHASAYFQSRRGTIFRSWAKGVYAVGAASQLILAWRQGRGPAPDSPYLNGLRRDVRRYGRYHGRAPQWHLLADTGFDGRGVAEGDLIPPMRRHGQLVAPARRARAELVAAARLDGLYGQRWKCETVHSVIKRKTGDTIRSRLSRNQRLEPALKGLVYNLHRMARPLPAGRSEAD
jgi:hypothetical protein